MRIIPVIDVLKGNVVHGKKGERNKYVPITSVICRDSNPLNVAMTFRSEFNFNEIYVADLDSIMKGIKEFNYVKNITKTTGMQVIIDAGITKPDDVNLLLRNGANIVIIATETLNNFQQLAEIVNKFGSEKIITSIDLFEGKIMAKGTEINKLSPLEVAFKIKELGIFETIVLELTRVGSNQGVALDYLEKIQNKTNLKIITGGGVRSFQDLIDLKKFNFSGLLIATAFHNGSISPKEIKKFYEF
ncbi:MAG: HisA/HisF-related TIM barrel protein [Candidatus Hodarchaeota archaeon]